MHRFLLHRLILGFFAVIFSCAIMFVLMRMLPGSPVGRLVGFENYNSETAHIIIEKYGLDKPLIIQLINYIFNLFQGEWGYSYISGRSVWDIIIPKLIPTALLAIPVAVFSFIFGIKLAVLSLMLPRRIRGFVDTLCSLLSAVPNYIVAFLLLYSLSYRTHIFPTVGMRSTRMHYSGAFAVIDLLWHLVLPVTSLSIVDIAYYYKLITTSLRIETQSDYANFLRLNGVPEKVIIRKYISKNSIIPAIYTFSMSLTRVVTGSLYIEVLFAWPGLGRLLYQSILDRDYLVLSAGFFLVTGVVVIFMLVVDIIYALVDPRIRRKITGA